MFEYPKTSLKYWGSGGSIHCWHFQKGLNASLLTKTLQVCLLLKHHADHHLKNLEGQEPLDIAVAAADADIVTLLRFSSSIL